MQQCGTKNGRVWARVVAYVTARAIQDRLDLVCGPENWKNVFRAGPAGGVLCGLAIRIDDEWVTKWNGAENTDIESVKGGLSAATKRAAVEWGIGRYLYGIEEGRAQVHERGRFRGCTKDGTVFRWDSPELPTSALRGNGTRSAPYDPHGARCVEWRPHCRRPERAATANTRDVTTDIACAPSSYILLSSRPCKSISSAT